jgi:hypothetical protein
MAEAIVLETIQCGFDSHPGYCVLGGINYFSIHSNWHFVNHANHYDYYELTDKGKMKEHNK